MLGLPLGFTNHGILSVDARKKISTVSACVEIE